MHFSVKKFGYHGYLLYIYKIMFKRTQLKFINLPKDSGVYFWYISSEGASKLGIKVEKCFQKENKYLIYIGLAKSIKQRLEWHCFEKNRKSNIKSGFLSTLRQTLSALIVGNMNHSEKIINKFMDNYMEVEFEIRKDYKEYEKKLISEYNLPLNLRGNKSHPFYKTLKLKRKESKKNSLKLLQENLATPAICRIFRA